MTDFDGEDKTQKFWLELHIVPDHPKIGEKVEICCSTPICKDLPMPEFSGEGMHRLGWKFPGQSGGPAVRQNPVLFHNLLAVL